MGTLVHPGWVSQVLRLMPDRLHKALDAWSYQVARSHAAKRRLAGEAKARRADDKAPEYKLQPWRD